MALAMPMWEMHRTPTLIKLANPTLSNVSRYEFTTHYSQIGPERQAKHKAS